MNSVLINMIARACHEANAAFCLSIGETDGVYPTWKEAPDEQKRSCLDGVRFTLENSDLTPEDQHRNWSEFKKADGWVYGEKKDPVNKTHPCMVDYDQLPMEQRVKDYIFRAIVKSVAGSFMVASNANDTLGAKTRTLSAKWSPDTPEGEV
jgi:hypothetical protein